ncbi:unnamed protein product [Closterium sp. Naga37s-1]|nr:unnamed protein product [Closterium sp. Naga37s-1]
MLPHRVRVRDFAAARSSEFAALYAALDRARAPTVGAAASAPGADPRGERNGRADSAAEDAADGGGGGEGRRVVGRREWGARRRRDRVAVRHGTPRHLIRRTSSFVRRGGARNSGAGGTRRTGSARGGRGGRGGLARVVAGQVRRKRVKVAALEGHVDRGTRGAGEDKGGEARSGAGEWEEETSEKEGEAEEEGEACRRVRRWAQAKRLKQGVGGGRAWNEGAGHGGPRRVASHMWHAKRFHMADTWGYRLAARLHGRGRGSRAVVEAAGRAAVLHDASYHSAIQLIAAQVGCPADICALLARCTPPGALPLAPRLPPSTPHTPHAACTGRGAGARGEAAWGEAAEGEAWRRGVLELRAMGSMPHPPPANRPSVTIILPHPTPPPSSTASPLPPFPLPPTSTVSPAPPCDQLFSSASDASSSDVIGPASFMWKPVACAGGAAVQGSGSGDAPFASAVGAASSGCGGREGGGGEVKGMEEGMGWKQRRRERQGRRKQEQRRQRCVWVWVHALMLPDALAALTAASQHMGLNRSPPMPGQESSSEQKGWRRRRVSVESREGELCRLEVAGRAALPLLLSVLRPSAPFNTLSPALLPSPFPAAAAPAATASPAAPTSASPAGRSASSAAASARLQQSEASWKVLAEQGAHLPGGAVVGLRAVDARLLAGRGREAGGVAGGAPGGRIGSSRGQHTGSADVSHKGGLCFDWWRDVAASVDGASIAAAPTLWIPREQRRATRCRGEHGARRGEHGARRGGGNESQMEMHDAWEADEEARLTMGDSGEERAERREGVGGQRGGEVRGTAAAVTSTTPLPNSAPPPQRLLDAWRRALKLQGLMGAREAQRMGESVAGQWVQWQAGRGEGGSGGEGRGGGDGACGGEVQGGVVCGEQAGCDVVVVKHGCGAMQRAAVTRWSVILPSDWLQACWHPFILHGAHAIGLAERHTLFTAAGLPLFPYDYPETFGYRCHVAASYLMQRARYDRTPPSKRPLCPPLPPAWAAASGVWGGAGEGGERGRDGGEGGEGGGGEAEADVDLRVARCSAHALSALLPAALRHGSRGAAHGDVDGEGAGGRGVWVDGRVTDQGENGHAGQAGQVGSGGDGWKLGGVGGAHGSQVGGAHGSRVGGAHGSRVSVEWRRVGERERGSTTWEERGADAAAGGACVADGHGGGSHRSATTAA